MAAKRICWLLAHSKSRVLMHVFCAVLMHVFLACTQSRCKLNSNRTVLALGVGWRTGTCFCLDSSA